MAFLSVRQEGRDEDGPSLADTHAQETLVHPFDEVALSQVGVIGRIPRVTEIKHSSNVLRKRRHAHR